jgi:multimeric flavodoxin WrbA
MKVVAFNGSARKNGNTAILLENLSIIRLLF